MNFEQIVSIEKPVLIANQLNKLVHSKNFEVVYFSMYGMNENIIISLFPYLKPKFNTKKLSLLITDLQSKC